MLTKASKQPILRVNRQEKFDKRTIQTAVNTVESGLSRKAVCCQYGVSQWTLSVWMRVYGSASYHANKRVSFSDQQRRSVVRAITAGRMSIASAMLAYKIKSNSTLRKWIQAANQENAELAVLNKPVMEDPSQLLSPPPDVKALQQALEEARLKIAALETMMDIAEQQFNIQIRKKSGAKQSPK